MLLFSTNRTTSIRPSRGLGEPEISDPTPERCCAVAGCVSTDTTTFAPHKKRLLAFWEKVVTCLSMGVQDLPRIGKGTCCKPENVRPAQTSLELTKTIRQEGPASESKVVLKQNKAQNLSPKNLFRDG